MTFQRSWQPPAPGSVREDRRRALERPERPLATRSVEYGPPVPDQSTPGPVSAALGRCPGQLDGTEQLVKVSVLLDARALAQLAQVLEYRRATGPISRSALVREAVAWLLVKESAWLLRTRNAEATRARRAADQQPRAVREQAARADTVADALAATRAHNSTRSPSP